MKKILTTLAIALLGCQVALAQSVPAPTITAKSWLLLDETSGQILASQNADTRIEPASLTKIMTAYLVFDALKEKRLSLDQMVNVSVNAWKVAPGSSKMFIEPNKPVKVNDLLYGLMVQSGNDAAVALSEAVAGSEDVFVKQMNTEATQMGLKATHFDSPHGLPSPGTYSTAHDLSVLASRLIQDYPNLYKAYDSTKTFTYNHITQPNRNRLLWRDPSVDGLKTGHTESAGYCMIASAHRPNGSGERRLIAVVIGTDSDNARTQDSQMLLNWGFQNFDTVKLYAKNAPIASPQVWKGTQDQIKTGFTHDVYITVPKGTAEKMKPVIKYNAPLIAPIAANTKVGTLDMEVDGKSIAELPIVSLEKVNAAGFFGKTWDSLRLWMH
jgi:D-alanyl-D-alanine carboxypeptidase (penicillin-binding protein 5/6)